jgi:CBS domain-containing protein
MHPVAKQLIEARISEMELTEAVHTCGPETALSEVVKTLQASHVGSIIITDGNRPIGIFTERDYLTKIAGRDIDEAKTPIEGYMTKSPVCFTRDESIGKVMTRMKAANFRHIIVTDPQGELEGIISIRDAMNFILDKLSKA